MIHTNHPLASRDIDLVVLDLVERRGRVANSHLRLGVLEEVIGSIGAAADIVALLSTVAGRSA